VDETLLALHPLGHFKKFALIRVIRGKITLLSFRWGSKLSQQRSAKPSKLYSASAGH